MPPTVSKGGIDWLGRCQSHVTRRYAGRFSTYHMRFSSMSPGASPQGRHKGYLARCIVVDGQCDTQKKG